MKQDPITMFTDPHRGVECIEIAECMGYHLGTAFTALWQGDLDRAHWHLKRYDEQRGPLPMMLPHIFREVVGSRRVIFDRPSPWCEPVRYALAAICDICVSTDLRERCRLTEKAMHCTETAIADEGCIGRGQEP